MANTISVSVTVNKGDYVVTGDITAAGKYTFISDNTIQSFNGSVDGLGRFGATLKPDKSALTYRLEPDEDVDASALMSAALTIKVLIEAKFAPEPEPETQE